MYYPGAAEKANLMEPEWDKHVCDEQLTVHYTDGITDVLTANAEPILQRISQGQNTDLRQTDRIPFPIQPF